VEKRWLLKVEDSHVLRVLERLNEQRVEREPHQMLHQSVERRSFHALLRQLLRVLKRGLHQRQELPLPPGGWSLQADEVRSQMAEARSQNCGTSGKTMTWDSTPVAKRWVMDEERYVS
jgi:hypothetical protein